MKKFRKNLLTTLGALALVCVGAGAYNVASVTANAADSANDAKKLESMVLGDVSFRLTGDYGIRCDVTLDATDYADITAENSGITTGVLVIPTDLLDGELTLDTPYVGKGVTYDASNNVNKWVVADDGTAETYAYIDDVPTMSYTRNLTFCAYYTVDGATEYTATKTTSLTCVAQSLLQEDVADDTTLSDELSAIVEGYVSDYTVVFQEGVTGEELSRTAVSANGGIEENTVSKPETEPTLAGYEFKGWYVGDKEWNFETDSITGDTLITAEYDAIQYAPLTLNFSEYTVVPEFVSSDVKTTITDGQLTNVTTLWNKMSMVVSYDALVLKAGSTITVTATAVSNGMNIDLNGTYYKWVSANTTATVEITLTEDITLNTIAFRCSTDNGATYKIASIVIEEIELYAPLNLDFANYDVLPAFVSYTTGNAPTVVDGNLTAWYGNKKYTSISYDNVILNAGDTIVITCTTSADVGINVDLNGTSTCDKWISKGTTNASVTITISETTTLSSIGFYCSSAAGLTFKLASIVINQA